MGQHARAVGVKDAHHPDIHPVLPVVIEKECFRATLALVVAGTKPMGFTFPQ